MFFKNSRQTYALHLMNTLLNIFCYIISNVSIRKNLHRVQLMNESYPDRQDYSKKQCILRIQRGMTCFAQSIWGNQAKIPRISQKCQTIRGIYPSGSETASRSIRGIILSTRGISPIVHIS